MPWRQPQCRERESFQAIAEAVRSISGVENNSLQELHISKAVHLVPNGNQMREVPAVD